MNKHRRRWTETDFEQALSGPHIALEYTIMFHSYSMDTYMPVAEQANQFPVLTPLNEKVWFITAHIRTCHLHPTAGGDLETD